MAAASLATLAGPALPLLGLGGFQLQVGIDSLVIALLAVGLNIVVGWAGLLDLGYVAFFGFGAYGFALLSSVRSAATASTCPRSLSLPIVMIAAGVLGLIVGWPSRRLFGDYLAIVTLFFGEAFVEFTNNVAPSKLGGPNGIVSVDPIDSLRRQADCNKSYYYLLVVLLVATMAVLRLLDTSRTGRAWRAVSEDPLAAAAMTIPVNRVKLMAFAFGAMVAALAGTVFAAQQINVFPTDFDTPILILVYAGLILGGAGSIGGAATGALVVMVIYDGLLRSPADSAYLFYGLILLTMAVKLRPWRRLALVLAATVAFGFVAHAIAAAISARAVAGSPQSGGWLATVLRHWVIVPANPQVAQVTGNVGFVLLVVMLIALVQVGRAVAGAAAGADRVPGVVRVGNPPRRRTIDHQAAHDRGDPDSDDERKAAGTARGAAGGDPGMTDPLSRRAAAGRRPPPAAGLRRAAAGLRPAAGSRRAVAGVRRAERSVRT